MNSIKPYVLAAAAAAFIGTAAFAAEQNAQAPSADQQAANRDFGKVSKDGFAAFNDIRTARIDIFNGDTSDAKTQINDAVAALDRAKTDESIFTKAESELKTPSGLSQPNHANRQVSADKVQWLPIDGAMTLDENYVATPAKAAGVAKANSQLKSGDQAHALETLRLAGVDVSFDMAVAPLKTSLAGVDKAQQLADSGQWYEANQALKGVQDDVHFDVQNYSSVPKNGARNHAKTADATGSTEGTQHTASTEK